MRFFVCVASRQGHPTAIADRTANKMRVAPAGTAQSEVALNRAAAGQAARWIDKRNRRLKPLLWQSMFPFMTTPMTDSRALALHRIKSIPEALFLHEAAADEVQDRLTMVNRRFNSMALITGFPDFWKLAYPDARLMPDADTLALESESQDLILHMLALHWANDPVGQLIQCRRALRPDGLFIAACLGGETLQELRGCLGEAEISVTGGLSPRIAPMAELRDLGGLLQRAGFALPVADMTTLTVEYRDAWHLMRDLRAMGETNALDARLRKPTRRAVFNQAADIYAKHFATPAGRIKATFEILFLTGWAPADSQQKPLRPGSAAQRLADALATDERPLRD